MPGMAGLAEGGAWQEAGGAVSGMAEGCQRGDMAEVLRSLLWLAAILR